MSYIAILNAIKAGMIRKKTEDSVPTKIQEYWYGFVVVDQYGVALSGAFKNKEEAVNFVSEYEKDNN